MTLIAALPMYDWPEMREETDARWAGMRLRFRRAGIEAPERLIRRNGDMPPVAGGIRDDDGTVVAPDPASLPPDGLDLHVLWLHPGLLISETCWGPMELGLQKHVNVVGQSAYDDVAGGNGAFYSSAIIARKGGSQVAVEPPAAGTAALPLAFFRNSRFAYNEERSLSGYLSLRRDLEAEGEGLEIFPEHVETGAHRESIRAVAEGRADVAAIDCRSWMLARAFEPAAADVHVIGWTARRKGIPFIRSRLLDLPVLSGIVS